MQSGDDAVCAQIAGVVSKTPKAICVEVPRTGRKVWLPLSQVMSHDPDQKVVWLPRWLAKARELPITAME